MGKKFLMFYVVFALVVGMLFLGAQLTVKTTTTPVASVDGVKTYANSQVDTITYVRPTTLAGAAFSAAFADSFSVTNVIMRRKVGGQYLAVVAGDTLIGAVSGTAAGARVATVTLAPLSEAYVFIVTYAGSANGVTSAQVRYDIQQQKYEK